MMLTYTTTHVYVEIEEWKNEWMNLHIEYVSESAGKISEQW